MQSTVPEEEDGCHAPPQAFVPCVEDAAFTREVGRHPAAFQRTLDAASYRYLAATSRLANDPASATLQESHRNILSDSYQCLWRQRASVPKAARREWFETVMIHLLALDRLEVGLLWLMDHASAPPEHTASVAERHSDRAAEATTAAAGTADPERKVPKGKKATVDAHPLWYLWQDAQRHLHHLTLRLHTWTPTSGGAYAAREPARPSDLVRMDSAAFTWRVLQWTRVSCLVLADPSASLHVQHPGETALSEAALLDEFSRALNSNTSSFAKEEPELFSILGAMASPSFPTTSADHIAEQRVVAGALLYRMLVEVMLIRLRALPRCMFTWRLLRDVLRRSACCTTPPAAASALGAMGAYVDAVILPYLQQRDCHLGNVRHTATAIQAHFTRLATLRIQELHAAATVAADLNAQEKESMQPDHCPDPPLTFDSEGRPSEQQRLDMSTAMRNILHHMCACNRSIRAPSVVATNVLANEDDEQGSASSDISLTTDLVRAAVRDVHHRKVDDKLLFSGKRRALQLTVFFYHYFTQGPTPAFDRVSRGATADTPSTTAEAESDL